MLPRGGGGGGERREREREREREIFRQTDRVRDVWCFKSQCRQNWSDCSSNSMGLISPVQKLEQTHGKNMPG